MACDLDGQRAVDTSLSDDSQRPERMSLCLFKWNVILNNWQRVLIDWLMFAKKDIKIICWHLFPYIDRQWDAVRAIVPQFLLFAFSTTSYLYSKSMATVTSWHSLAQSLETSWSLEVARQDWAKKGQI